MGRVIGIKELTNVRRKARTGGKKVVFTNGVFDILHRGHVEYLGRAKELGDILIVGLNSDRSVRKIKGDRRPLVPQEDRAFILAGLKDVSYVCLFDQETPLELIETLLPDVLVKGGDYTPEDIVGRGVVEENGGRVVVIPEILGRSTTQIINRIKERY
ncbi:D-glycero-beta-D-manno-heptose 1-phosphate adenylyltransferase [candidate division KSB1 bacterium]|nr:D-glycero-beta-D-manno-heptose 1-phosphate adenylyltransferase [candidate division KSB1 bacterium]